MGDSDGFLYMLIAALVVHLGAMAFALRDLGNRGDIGRIAKGLWLILLVPVVVSGPLIYLYYGRGDRSWGNRIRAMQERARQRQEIDSER